MGVSAAAEACASGEGAQEILESPGRGREAGALAALCLIARFHQVAADPATLAHQLGLQGSDAVGTDDLLRAAKHLGLKARRQHDHWSDIDLTSQAD